MFLALGLGKKMLGGMEHSLCVTVFAQKAQFSLGLGLDLSLSLDLGLGLDPSLGLGLGLSLGLATFSNLL